MSIVSDNYYRPGLVPKPYNSINRSREQDGPLKVPRFRLGATSAGELRSQTGPTGDLYMDTGLVQEKLDLGQQQQLRPQAYKDQSADTRDGLASFFATGAKYKERDAYTQNHISVSGIPGVVHMAVLDAKGQKIPHAPFSWGGRSYHCDSDGKFTILERQYFQNTVCPIHISVSPYPFIYAVLCCAILCNTSVHTRPIFKTHLQISD